MKKRELADAHADLEVARKAYEEAAARKEAASREETSCRNQLNAMQKAFDEAVAEIRKDAPWDTTWDRRGKETAAG